MATVGTIVPRPSAARRAALQVGVWTLRLAVVAVALVVWETLSNNETIDPLYFGKPSLTWDALQQYVDDGVLRTNIQATLQVLLLGWGIGIVVGSTIGVVVGASRNARDFFEPFLVFFNALPRLLFLPFFAVWLGFGLAPKVSLVVLVVVVVIALTVASGVRETSDELVLHARLLGASPGRLVRDVYVPSIAVWLLSSSRTTVGFAFQATIAAEFFGTASGLGYLLTTAQGRLNSGQVFAVLAVMFGIGLLIDLVLGAVERRVSRWLPQ